MLLSREHETPFNKAPLIRAMAALLMVITILSAITRIATRRVTIRSFKLDDTLVAVSTIVAVAQSLAVVYQGAKGLGKIRGLTAEQVSSILKAQYASDELFIAALFLAKISATRTIWDMAPRKRRRLIWATEALIGVWAVSSITALCFQCSLPEPWDYMEGQCFNRFALWLYVDLLNIFTDLAITSILVAMFLHLKTSTAKKTLVIIVFGCRTLYVSALPIHDKDTHERAILTVQSVVPPIICHMYYYSRVVDSRNPMFDMWPTTIIRQVIQCLSIMATCIPYLKPFLDSLESGQMATGDLRATISKGSNSRSRSHNGFISSQKSRPREGTSRGLKSVSTMASNASHRRQNYEMMDMDKPRDRGYRATVTTASEQPGGLWDGQSHTSQTVLVEQSWQVDVQRKTVTPDPES
ncbi:hypothetical protein ACJZ2D_008896 [Fusarium nematophilum]